MIEFTDRYKALGIPYPNPETMCNGQCEGTGVYPQFIMTGVPDPKKVYIQDDYTPLELEAWLECHRHCNFINSFTSRLKHMEWWYWKSLFRKCDGWHFIECPDCKGTGKRARRREK